MLLFLQEKGIGIYQLEFSKYNHEKSDKKQQMGMWRCGVESSSLTCPYICQCSKFCFYY